MYRGHTAVGQLVAAQNLFCAQNVRNIHDQAPHCALLNDTLHGSLPYLLGFLTATPASPTNTHLKLRQWLEIVPKLIRFEILMSFKLHLVALHNRTLERFQGYGLVTLTVVIRVAEGQEALNS
jgi:hypothetical protein